MGTYHYEAVDQAGRSERGVLEAESERLARQQLLSRGLLTVSLKAGRSRAAARARSAGLRRTELSWLTRQLASLVAAGLSLEASLGVVIEQATRRPLVQLLAALRADIRAGLGRCGFLRIWSLGRFGFSHTTPAFYGSGSNAMRRPSG